MATGKKSGKLSRAKKAIGKKVADRKSAKSGRASAAANKKAEKHAAGYAAAVADVARVNARKNGTTAESANMDLEFLRGLIEAVDNSGIDSVEIDREGTKVRISKTPPAAVVAMAPMHAPMMQAPAMHAHEMHHAPAAASAPAAAAAPAAEAPKSNYTDIKSPMVGTFYLAPAPEAPAYVEIGSHVTKGQTLCILEAMKLMNELESEVDGIVREILVDNADPVEYGQVLFRIEPAR